jgi:hypothetical protein
MIPAMIVAASTVAIVAIAAVVIVALLALIYLLPRGGRRRSAFRQTLLVALQGEPEGRLQLDRPGHFSVFR